MIQKEWSERPLFFVCALESVLNINSYIRRNIRGKFIPKGYVFFQSSFINFYN